LTLSGSKRSACAGAQQVQAADATLARDEAALEGELAKLADGAAQVSTLAAAVEGEQRSGSNSAGGATPEIGETLARAR